MEIFYFVRKLLHNVCAVTQDKGAAAMDFTVTVESSTTTRLRRQ